MPANGNDSQMPADGTTPRTPSRMGLFLRSNIFDFLLVLAASAALVFTVSYGFNSAPDLRGNVGMIVGICAVLLVPLYLGGWSKRAIPVVAVAYVAVAAGVVMFVSAMSPEAVDLFVDGQVNDVENNYAIFGLVCVTVPPITYLLSRRTWGVAVLLFLSVLTCGVIQFLYRDWISAQPGTLAAMAVYVSVGALFMVQGYRQGVLKSHIVKRTSFFGAFAFGVLGSLLCMGVGALVFMGIIANMGLMTVDSKPFADYFIRPVLQYNGTFEQQKVYDPDTATSNLTENSDKTNDDESGAMGEKGEEGEGNEESNEQSEQESAHGGGFTFISVVVDTLDLDEWSDSFEPLRFELPLPLRVFLWLLLPLLIALIVYLRYRQRFRRLRKIEQQPLPERVALLYNFFMRGFKRLKVEKPDTATPLEFALSSAGELAGFMRNDSQADLFGITLIYQRAVYGAGNVTEEDYNYVRDYYLSFFKNAHARMGHPRWAFSGFWRI